MKTALKNIMRVFRYRYQRIMFLVFMAFALGITVLGVGNVAYNTTRTERTRNQMLANSNAQSLSLTYTVALQTVNNLRLSSEASQWAAADTAARERMEAVRLRSLIGRLLTGLDDLQYSIGTWKINGYAPVVYLNGSAFDQESFLLQQFGMDHAAWEETVAAVKQEGQYFLSTVGTENSQQLICLYYHRYTVGEAIYFIILPVAEDSNTWAITEQGRLLASNNPDSTALNRALSGNLHTGVYTELFQNDQLQYIYLAPDTSLQRIGAFVLLFVLLLGLVTVFMYWVARKIYHPIDRLLQDLDIRPGDNPIDEFAMLRNNTLQLRVLNRKMHDALNSTLLQQHEEQYVRLLYGLAHSSEDPGERSVCLALLAFDENSSGDEAFLVKNDLRLYAQQNGLVFVGIQQTRWAVIFFDKEIDTVEATIRELFDLYLAEAPVTAAISEVKRGETAYRQAYRQALHVLDEHAPEYVGEIFRADQCSQSTTKTFHYPMALESELIHNAIEGNEAALELFDENILENLGKKTLPVQQVEDYLLALVNTLNRIYILLQTTVQNSLSHPMSGAEMLIQFEAEGEQAVVHEIRAELEAVIRAIARRRSTDNNQLMQKMLTYIHDHYMQDIGLTDIADSIGITPQHCSLAFKQLTNDNFKNYLNSYRIKKAQALQDEKPGITTTELAGKVGFNSANSFIRAYKKYTGISPQNYRKETVKE